MRCRISKGATFLYSCCIVSRWWRLPKKRAFALSFGAREITSMPFVKPEIKSSGLTSGWKRTDSVWPDQWKGRSRTFPRWRINTYDKTKQQYVWVLNLLAQWRQVLLFVVALIEDNYARRGIAYDGYFVPISNYSEASRWYFGSSRLYIILCFLFARMYYSTRIPPLSCRWSLLTDVVERRNCTQYML